MLGYQPAELVGRGAATLFHDPAELEPILEQTGREGMRRGVEVELRRADDSCIWVRSHIHAIRDDSGKTVGFEATVEDVTDFKRTEEELRGALERAKQSDRMKSLFLASVSHEMRTPLNVILGCAGVLADRVSKSDARGVPDLVERIERTGKRLLRTIQRLLDLPKLETQSFVVQPSPISLAEFVAKHVEDFRGFASAKGLDLSFVSEADDARVDFDEYCLSQALANLLDNAIKFTESGEIRVRVHRGPDACLRLQVRDTGIGIDPAFRPRLFHTFAQEPRRGAHRSEGSGLGLALVKRYVELNGATLEVEGEKGRGSTFTIRFR